MIYYEPEASKMLKEKWFPQAYVVLCLVNAKVYNGIVINFGKTWERRTQRELDQIGGANKHFTSAIRKYGKKKFHRFLFAIADTVEEIRNVERQQILDTFSYLSKFGYNKTMGGEGAVATPETAGRMKAYWSSLDPAIKQDRIARLQAGKTNAWRKNNKLFLKRRSEQRKVGNMLVRQAREEFFKKHLPKEYFDDPNEFYLKCLFHKDYEKWNKVLGYMPQLATPLGEGNKDQSGTPQPAIV